ETLDKMKSVNPHSVEWLLSHADPKHWAEVYFPGRRFGHLTSNIAESLNSWLSRVRELPLYPMLEAIRQKLMDWFAKRRNSEDKTQGIVVTKIAKKIQLLQEFGRRYRARM